MGDEVREGWFAGFGKVNLVAGPESTPLFAQVGLGIVRRIDAPAWRDEYSLLLATAGAHPPSSRFGREIWRKTWTAGISSNQEGASG